MPPPIDGALGPTPAWLLWAALGALALVVACRCLDIVATAYWTLRREPHGRGRSRRAWTHDRVGRLLAALRLLRWLAYGAWVLALALSLAGWVGPWGWAAAVLLAPAAVALVAAGPVLWAKRRWPELGRSWSELLWLLSMASAPVLVPWQLVQRRLAHALRLDVRHAQPFWTPAELAALAESAQAESLGGGGGELWRSLIEFRDTIIREIMVPRTEMLAVSRAADREQLTALLLEAGHSRLPVYDETVDQIVGLLHVKDLIAAQWAHPPAPAAGPPPWQQLVRPVFYVPEVMKISELLREFQRRKTHMAIVVDEYGGTSGVVTLEDIIEEIVGEIHDEYDVDEKQVRKVGDKVVADGKAPLWDLEAVLGLKLPSDGTFETLAGFMTARLGALPQRGLQVSYQGWTFTVKEASAKRVEVVEVQPQGAAPAWSKPGHGS